MDEIAIIADLTLCERCDYGSMWNHKRGEYEGSDSRTLHMQYRRTTRAGIRRIGELLYPDTSSAGPMWYFVWQRATWVNTWAERYLKVRLGRRVFETNRLYVRFLLSKQDEYGMSNWEPVDSMSETQRRAWAWAR